MSSGFGYDSAGGLYLLSIFLFVCVCVCARVCVRVFVCGVRVWGLQVGLGITEAPTRLGFVSLFFCVRGRGGVGGLREFGFGGRCCSRCIGDSFCVRRREPKEKNFHEGVLLVFLQVSLISIIMHSSRSADSNAVICLGHLKQRAS